MTCCIAGPDGDFDGNNMIVIFNPEDDSIQIPVTINDDTIVEADETFQIILSIPDDPPSGLGLSTTSSSTVITIFDDESELRDTRTRTHSNNSQSHTTHSTHTTPIHTSAQ